MIKIKLFILLIQIRSLHFILLFIIKNKPEMDELENEEAELKKKMIIFRNSKTGEVMAQRQIPKYFRLDDNFIFDLTGLSRKLIMLFIDVLCRGYHPVKGFQQNFRNIFNDQQNQFVKKERNTALIRIQNVEAISTIWRCLSRQLGKPYKNYNNDLVSKQLFDELERKNKQTMIEDRTNLNKKKKNVENYEVIKSKMEQLNGLIKEEMKSIGIRSRNDEKKSTVNQKHVVKVLQQQILNYQLDIFTRSIVGIRLCIDSPENCQIILEQCYPSMILSKKEAIQILGEQFYNKKLNSYNKNEEKYSQQECILFCHRCLIPLNHLGIKISCNDKLATLNIQLKNIMTNPYMYCKRIINESVDYKSVGEYIHPYLIYYQTKISKMAVCNRYYCNRCQNTQITQTGACKYCEGLCQCHRCRGMDELTQMMAVYLDNQGDLNQLVSKFRMKFTNRTLSYVDSKKELKINNLQSFYTDIEYYYDTYHSQNILLEYNQLKQFEKNQYFSVYIQNVDKKYNKIEKYKQRVIRLPQSKLDRQEMQMKEKQKDKRIKSITDAINGNKREKILQKRELKESQRQEEQKKERQIEKLRDIQREKERDRLRDLEKRNKYKQKEMDEKKAKNNKKNEKKEDSEQIERKNIFFDQSDS